MSHRNCHSIASQLSFNRIAIVIQSHRNCHSIASQLSFNRIAIVIRSHRSSDEIIMCLIAFQIVVSSAATIPGIFHLSGYILRFLLSPQMADKAQRHIYASRHAGGGEELAVFYPARIVDPADLVAHRDDPVKRYLVGGRPPAVQRATLGQ